MGQRLDVQNNDKMSKARVKQVYRTPEKIRFKPEDVSPNNGYILDQTYVPEEILVLILSYLDSKSLGKLRFVCRKWCEVIRDQVWKIKAERQFSKRFKNIKKHRKWPSEVYQAICWKDPYGRNLLKNHSGHHNFDNWTIHLNGGDRWKVEKPPIGVVGAENSEFNPKSCFATSYQRCGKEQKIDLYAEGIYPDVLDNYQPYINISEWYSARWDCGSRYELTVSLLDYDNREVKKFKFEARMTNWAEGWKEAKHRFQNYGAGVQYVLFSHVGCDSQFWAGHYGSKMARASVIVDLQSMEDPHDKTPEEKAEMSGRYFQCRPGERPPFRIETLLEMALAVFGDQI